MQVESQLESILEESSENTQSSNIQVWSALSPLNLSEDSNVITWAIWTDNDGNLSNVMSQSRVDAINEKLQQMQLKDRLQILLVTGNAGIDQNTLKEINEIADIISFCPRHVRFEMAEWEEMFVDLEIELKENGRLHTFYQKVSPQIWK